MKIKMAFRPGATDLARTINSPLSTQNSRFHSPLNSRCAPFVSSIITQPEGQQEAPASAINISGVGVDIEADGNQFICFNPKSKIDKPL